MTKEEEKMWDETLLVHLKSQNIDMDDMIIDCFEAATIAMSHYTIGQSSGEVTLVFDKYLAFEKVFTIYAVHQEIKTGALLEPVFTFGIDVDK